MRRPFSCDPCSGILTVENEVQQRVNNRQETSCYVRGLQSKIYIVEFMGFNQDERTAQPLGRRSDGLRPCVVTLSVHLTQCPSVRQSLRPCLVTL
jgi:hypothetical protein